MTEQGIPTSEYQKDPSLHRVVFATVKVNRNLLRRVDTVNRNKKKVITLEVYTSL